MRRGGSVAVLLAATFVGTAGAAGEEIEAVPLGPAAPPAWFVPACECADPDLLAPHRCYEIAVEDGYLKLSTPTADRLGSYDAVRLGAGRVAFFARLIDQATQAPEKLYGVLETATGRARVVFDSAGAEVDADGPAAFEMICRLAPQPAR